MIFSENIYSPADSLDVKMDCALCNEPIKDFHEKLNRLKIDDKRSVDICQECIEKFLKWQQEVFTELFPTKAAKKWLGKTYKP